jgi:hypothetical protein
LGLAIDIAERLHIAYQDHNADLKYTANVAGIWERHYPDTGGNYGADPKIAIDPSGLASIVYVDNTVGTVKLITSP